METNNLLNAGMDSDMSKFFLAKDKYLQAYNFRALTELGESNAGLVNIRGNECAVKFPTMRPVYKIAPQINTPTTLSDTATITVNSQVTGNIIVNSSTTGLDIYNAIKALSNCYQNPAAVNPTFSVAYKDEYVVISQIPTYTNCSRTDSSAITITITPSGGAVNFLKFYNFAGTASATQVNYVNAITTNRIIGHTFVLDNIYLFTAPEGVTPPSGNDSFTGLGAVWKLTYDESTKTTVLTLLYSQWLDFNENYPIAPSAATGRYESDVIERIYWTDFYNKVRTLNVNDPQLMALNPKLASLIPSVGFDIPILKEIIGGSLLTGTYELCYRLKQSLGAVSNYSTLSNMVHLIDQPMTGFVGYEGSIPGNNSNKGIKWVISNLDTKFDTIEYILLYRDSKTDIATVYSVKEDNIPNTGIVTIDVTAMPTDTIPLDEFLTISATFTHAKTVDTKDNRLFWGNVKAKKGSVGNWDARAFRAKTSGGNDIYLTNNGSQTSNTLAFWTNLSNNPKTNDCINSYYDSTGNFGANACYFKPNTAVLGGAGTNISYEFGTYSIQLNNMNRTSNSDDGFNVYNDVPFREADNLNSTSTYDLIASPDDSGNQIYHIKDVGSMKSPYLTSVIKGLQHEEIYRFGFQPYDLEGNPMFTEWIGDIKMPTFGDTNNNPDTLAAGAGINDFRLSYLHSGYDIYGQILYIKFTIDVTALKDTISGYRIVRMERKSDSDKTILGCGLLTPSFAEDLDSNCYLPACFYYVDGTSFPLLTTFTGPAGPVQGEPWNPYPTQDSWESLSIASNAITPSGGTFGANGSNVKTFDCFDFVQSGGVSFASGDKIFIRSRQFSRTMDAALNGPGNNQGYRWWYQSGGGGADWYDLPPNAGTKYTIRNRPVGDLLNGPGAWNAATGNPVTTKFQSGYDSDEMAYYLHMYVDEALFGNIATIAATAAVNKTIDDAKWVGANLTAPTFSSGRTFHNYGRTFGAAGASDGLRPAVGHPTLAVDFATGYNDYDAPFNCINTTKGQKLLALYYKPNNTQYGGATYVARAGNEYIACGSYIPIRRDDIILTNNLVNTIDVFGGDVHLDYWDIQKCAKDNNDGSQSQPVFTHYTYQGALQPYFPGSLFVSPIPTTSQAATSITYFFPCTSIANQEVRYGSHVNSSCSTNTYITTDEDFYSNYHSNEANVVKFFSQPIDFVETDKWINRIYYSEVKYNNETKDSWQVYKTNNFYDVEGNYGAINCLISLREQLYYIQERAFGYLYINPITTISGDNGLPVTLGKGATIEKHQNLSIDVGTKHQWSVYRSQSAITWVDVRNKKIYMFDGALKPISDTHGQRNFVIKRLHPDLILNDNPILKKGIITTYDYYHNEFLYSFINDSATDNNDENYTLVFSEPAGKFTGLYSFVPTIYINNNRYLLTIDKDAQGVNIGKIWVHNYGEYCNFYGTVNDSMLKVLINDNPLNTKVFDNLSWNSQSIVDNVIWVDDLITPNANPNFTATDNVNYIDDTFSAVRCYNEWENTDWTTLTLNSNLKKREQNWSIAIPRNKVNYDVNTPPVNIFSAGVLTKTDFGERMRDKWMIVDLKYTNTPNRRFIVHNIKTTYRISAR